MSERLSEETFLAICNFPFTHLEGASVTCRSLTLASALALQQLLSLPTLCRAHIECYNYGTRTKPAHFLQIWDRCSTSLRHLVVGSANSFSGAVLSTQHSSSPIPLESLQILQSLQTLQISRNIDRWLTHTLCPLDFSRLKALSILSNTEVLQSPTFLPAHRTIEVLDLTVYVRPTHIRLLPPH